MSMSPISLILDESSISKKINTKSGLEKNGSKQMHKSARDIRSSVQKYQCPVHRDWTYCG